MLYQLYREQVERRSDISEHCPILRQLAAECDLVVEFGTRGGVSTVALLAGQPQRLITYDLYRNLAVENLSAVCGRTELVFEQGDTLEVTIEPCDLLFIDTLHTADQLWGELTRHGGQVRRWIALHDTCTFGEQGEDGGPGLLPALRRFLREHPEWCVIYHTQSNNGFTLLSRDPGDNPFSTPATAMPDEFRAALAEYIPGDRGGISLEEYRRRIEICAACDQRQEGKCGIRDVEVSATCSTGSCECPIGKWFSDEPAPESWAPSPAGDVVKDEGVAEEVL